MFLKEAKMESIDNRIKTPDAAADAFSRGRQVGLATAALALSIVSFISLLGLEKAILAATLGIVAWRIRPSSSQGKKRSLLAIAVAVIYALIFIIVFALFHDKFADLIHMMQKLS